MVEARDVAKHLTVPRATSHNKNYPAPNVNSAGMEKPCPGVNKRGLTKVGEEAVWTIWPLVWEVRNHKHREGHVMENSFLFCWGLALNARKAWFPGFCFVKSSERIKCDKEVECPQALLLVGGKNMKRGDSLEDRTWDPGEQPAPTSRGLWQIPWRKMDTLSCFPWSVGFSVFVANTIIRIMESVVCEISNQQKAVGPSPSWFVDDRFETLISSQTGLSKKWRWAKHGEQPCPQAQSPKEVHIQ